MLLLLAGLVAGFIAGLVGVGGGIIFAPVLFFYFQAAGVSAAVLTPLTLGSSLLCTLLVALASAYHQHRRGAVLPRLMVIVGLCSAVAVYLTTRFVTTQPWYTPAVFQILFSVVLLTVVARMLWKQPGASSDAAGPAAADASQHTLAALFGTGTAAGAVSSAVGVGGGVVLVPAYNSFLQIPIHKAVGTSSATIVLISLAGVLTYGLRGLAVDVPATALGYIDVRALLLCLPALLTARWGVQAAHRFNVRALQAAFGLVAVLVAGRLLWTALGG